MESVINILQLNDSLTDFIRMILSLLDEENHYTVLVKFLSEDFLPLWEQFLVSDLNKKSDTISSDEQSNLEYSDKKSNVVTVLPSYEESNGITKDEPVSEKLVVIVSNEQSDEQSAQNKLLNIVNKYDLVPSSHSSSRSSSPTNHKSWADEEEE
jgi:hypothetical protein